MSSKITIETNTNRQQKRRNRERIRNDSNDGSKSGSQSPPLKPRVVILAKNPQKSSPTPSVSHHLNNTLLSSNQSPNSHNIIKLNSLHSSQQSSQMSSNSVSNTNNHLITDELIDDLVTNMPKIMKLIDNDTLVFMESPASEYMFNDNISSGGFSVITAVGLEGVGKSSVLNRIAGKEVFKVHNNQSVNGSDPLKHMTHGLDLHITKERLLLIDSQPLLSASVLDEYLKSCPLSSSTGVDIAEPENYSFMISLQILSFLFATCDYIIIVCEWMVDIHLIKLMSTAVMMVGDTAQKADIIWYFPNSKTKINRSTIDSLLGRGLYVTVICEDEKQLLNAVMKAPSKRSVGENSRNSSHTSEKSWLLSSQRFWETSIRKSSLYSDYGRFLP